MDFSFNEEQLSLGETVARVLADFPTLTGPEPERGQDREAWQALAEIGMFALLVPEEQGGVGLTLVDCAPAVEALGSGLAPPIVSETLAATELLKRLGTLAQKADLLPRIAAGELRLSIALSERGADHPIDQPRCTVENGRLNGSKITVAGAADAGLLVVLATRGGKAVLTLVEAGAAGVTIREHETIDPSAALAEVRFDNVELSEEDFFGQQAGEGAADILIDIGATIQAGLAIGLARQMKQASVAYACDREQFGRPIGAFQAIKHRCADMQVALEAGRATAYYAFWSCASNQRDRSRSASAAKAYCGEIARDACNDAIQIHGGMGFTWELGLHRYLRRAKIIEHAYGGRGWHYARTLRETLAMRTEVAGARRNAA